MPKRKPDPDRDPLEELRRVLAAAPPWVRRLWARAAEVLRPPADDGEAPHARLPRRDRLAAN